MVGVRVGQIRIVFKLPENLVTSVFGSHLPASILDPLVYIDWFSRPPSHPDKNNGMFKITRPVDVTKRDAAILPLTSIRRSCHLFPHFPKGKVSSTKAKEWTSDTVLELCDTFHINNYVDMHAFQTIY